VILTQTPISSLSVSEILNKQLYEMITQLIVKAIPTYPASKIVEVNKNAQFFSTEAGVYKQLTWEHKGNFNILMKVPECVIKEMAMKIHPAMEYEGRMYASGFKTIDPSAVIYSFPGMYLDVNSIHSLNRQHQYEVPIPARTNVDVKHIITNGDNGFSGAMVDSKHTYHFDILTEPTLKIFALHNKNNSIWVESYDSKILGELTFSKQ